MSIIPGNLQAGYQDRNQNKKRKTAEMTVFPEVYAAA